MRFFHFMLFLGTAASLPLGHALAEAVESSSTKKEQQAKVGEPCMQAVKNMDKKGKFKQENLKKAIHEQRNPVCVQWWRLLNMENLRKNSQEELQADPNTGVISAVPKAPVPSSGAEIYFSKDDPSHTINVDGADVMFNEQVILPPGLTNADIDNILETLPDDAMFITLPSGENAILYGVKHLR